MHRPQDRRHLQPRFCSRDGWASSAHPHEKRLKTTQARGPQIKAPNIRVGILALLLFSWRATVFVIFWNKKEWEVAAFAVTKSGGPIVLPRVKAPCEASEAQSSFSGWCWPSRSGYVKTVITGYSQIQLALRQHATWILREGSQDPTLGMSMESNREDKHMTDSKDYKGGSLIQSPLGQVLSLLPSPVDMLFLRVVIKNNPRVELGKAVSAKGTPSGRQVPPVPVAAGAQHGPAASPYRGARPLVHRTWVHVAQGCSAATRRQSSLEESVSMTPHKV